MAFNFTLKSTTAEASIYINRDVLSTFLNAANRVIPKKTIVPILKYVHFYYKEQDGYVRATDTDCFVELSLKGNRGTGCIDVAVDLNALMILLDKSPRSGGTLLIEREGTALTIKDGIVTCGKLAGIDGSECPRNDLFVGDSCIVTLTEYDVDFIDRYVAPLCIEDAQYPALNSVLFEMGDANYGFVATDRHALIFTEFIENATTQKAIPVKAVKAMSSLKHDGMLFIGDTTFKFTTGTYTVIGNCTGGVYPDFHKLIIRDYFDHEKDVDVGVLRADLIRLVTEKGKNRNGHCPVFISYSGDIVHAEEIPADYDEFPYGKAGGIKMDAIKLLKLLERFHGEVPAKFKSVDNLCFGTLWIDGNATTVFMPMR